MILFITTNKISEYYKQLWLSIILLFTTYSVIAGYPASAVKAAFLYNFSKFVSWPSSSLKKDTENFTICIYRQESLTREFGSIVGKKTQGKKIRLRNYRTTQGLSTCQIIFIPSKEKTAENKIFIIAKENHILTVSDRKGFIRNNGMIELFLKNGKMKFNINLRAARQSKLTFNSNLSKLANKVKQ